MNRAILGSIIGSAIGGSCAAVVRTILDHHARERRKRKKAKPRSDTFVSDEGAR